jgi:hypothetical protein
VPDLSGEDLEICFQKACRKGRHQGLVARQHNLIEWVELTVAIDDIGQAPKVEDLARSEGAGHDRELTREADTAVWGGAACSSDEAGSSSHCRARIILDVLPYLARQLSRGRNHNKHCCSSGVTKCVPPVAQVDSRTQRLYSADCIFG